jgi:CheY-like chemotaxis protein
MSDLKTNNSKTAGDSTPLIYVVDDEPMLLELAAVILEPQGYNLQTFRDPEMALQTFDAAQPRPDLVITDYAMHHMNGMQLIEKFRNLEPRLKILLVSGTVGEDIFQNSRIRPDKFLAKPYQSNELSQAVKTLLGSR